MLPSGGRRDRSNPQNGTGVRAGSRLHHGSGWMQIHAVKRTFSSRQHLAPLLALLVAGACGASAVAQTAGVAAASTAYPKGDFYEHLTAASGNSPRGCDWGWGASGSPHRTGPGNCDSWRVGPRWSGAVDGAMLFRDEIDIAALAGAATAGGAPLPLDASSLTGNFDHGAGVRMNLTGNFPQCRGYEMQIDYLGIFEWDAGAFNPDVPPAGPIGDQPDLVVQQSLTYRSSLHSLSVNGQTVGEGPLKLFGGMRYVRLSEGIDDLYDETSPTPSLPPVAVADLELTDILRNVSVDNNLIGFQGGLRSDLWGIGDRFFISGMANAGVYCNVIQRSSTFEQTDTFARVDDPTTAMVNESINTTATARSGFKHDRARVAFVGEAALNAVYQVNACTSARVGYQVLYLTGVELADEAFLGATPTNGDLLMHGWYAGVEYRR